LALLRSVAFDVHIDMDLDDLVRSEESVADTLLEGIRIDGFAEIMDVGNVFGFLRVAVRPIWVASEK